MIPTKQSVLFFLLTALAIRADDITLSDGKILKDAKVISHTPTTAMIVDSDGGASVPIDKLPAEWQAKLGYTAQAAADYTAQQNAADSKKRIADSLAKAALPATVVDTQIMPNGIIGTVCINATVDVAGELTTKPGDMAKGFVECKTEGLVDGAKWKGTVWRAGTYSYEMADGGRATIPKFTAYPEAAQKIVLSQ